MRQRFCISASKPGFRRGSRAFTLIELLVVIVILGILMAVAVPTFLSQQTKAQDSRTQQYLTTAFKAIRADLPGNNEVYPTSTSMASWVRASEPELTAESGDCLTGVTSAPVDAIMVDPSSTASSLQLCARSQSGNVWKLTATATGVQSLLDGTLVPLTMSGNEITDATRAADVQGDGLSSDSSTGIWEASTNLLPDGGFETGTGYLATLTGMSSVSQDTSVSKFGAASAQAVASGGTNTAGVGPDFINATVGTTYTVSGWVRNDLSGFQDRIELWFIESDGTTTALDLNGNYTPAPAGQWTYLTLTGTAPANTAYAQLKIRWATVDSSNIPAGPIGEVDGLQLEANTIATPFINTTAASASRGAARVQAPSSLLSATQGWVAARVRTGFGTGSTLLHPPVRVFNLSDGTVNNEILGGITSNNFEVGQVVSGSTIVKPVSVTFSTGDLETLVFAWDASNLYVSVNGGSFVSIARNGIPAGMSQLLIGANANGGNVLDCDILWLAMGNGTLSSSDAAQINDWGSSDPKVSQFPASAQADFTWNGADANGSLK